MHINLFELFFK